ncbi:MAG: class I SAM-dependent methyltransferase [Betaproteobacteria bacterium]|nr:MAG: class I SAM-dependent methyltransferase [Betaproteobacteria bacterium]
MRPARPSLTAFLPFTGERFTPEARGAIWYEHWHRYCVALSAVAGKRVLDAACGEGYGSWLLAGAAAEVVGEGRSNLRFVSGSCDALPLGDSSVDCVISFETIEHLSSQAAMLAEFRRVLAPHGALILSSPNKTIYSGESGYDNHFHVHELDRDELATMLGARFPRRHWYGQRALAHSLLWREDDTTSRSAELIALIDDRVEVRKAPAPAMYYVVVCGAAQAALPELPDLSIFDDGALSLYRDYERALLAEKRLFWDELDARKIAEARLADLVIAVNDLASSRQREEAVSLRVTSLDADLKRTQEAFAQVSGALDETSARLAHRETWRGWLRWPAGRVRRLFDARAR